MKDEPLVRHFLEQALDQGRPFTTRIPSHTMGIPKEETVSVSEQALRILRGGGTLKRDEVALFYQRGEGEGLYVRAEDSSPSLIDLRA
jgi:hypothetical protein